MLFLMTPAIKFVLKNSVANWALKRLQSLADIDQASVSLGAAGKFQKRRNGAVRVVSAADFVASSVGFVAALVDIFAALVIVVIIVVVVVVVGQ